MDVLLRKGFIGRVWKPGDTEYDTERLSWHRAIDPRQALVAEAADAWDVLAAVDTARQSDLPFAVQSTGHGTVAPADGALLLKTSRLSSVDVDPQLRVARVGAGARWSDVISAAARYGLAPLSGTASVGVAGYTVGGGAGLLSRKYGYAADSLLRAEAITAHARPVAASRTENPDLFWALRGGGGNFAVVTTLEFRLYPVDRLWGGIAFYPIERAAETLAYYREWAIAEPDEMTTAVVLTQLPSDPAVRVLALRAFFLGTPGDAEWILDPLLDVAGAPLAGGFRPMSFPETATVLGPPPPPMASRQHVDLCGQLSDGLIDLLLEPSPAGIEIRHWGGAMGRTSPDCGPIGHRHVPFSVMVGAAYADRATIDSYMDILAARMRRHTTGGTFLNFLTDTSRTRSAYTAEDYRRLLDVKRTWDPDNFFNHNHNISAAPAAVAR